MRRLVETARVGRLGTAGPEPHVVPVCFALVGDVVYSAVDHKPKRTRRLRRLADIEATGRACLLVDHYDDDWTQLWWVRLDGPAKVLDTAAAGVDALVAKYPQYAEHRLSGPVIALHTERWIGWAARAQG